MANQMSLIDDSRVLGREEELKEIIYYLLDCGNNDVGVLPIVGRGGIGKTTLAGLIFDDPSINKHFEIKLWVRVSTDFDDRRLTKSVLESIIDRKSCELMDLDILQNTLRDKLKGRKLLVVFDDVRTENEREWESLLPPFKAGGGGSKIIVTTPSQRVAAITGTFPPYNLEPLQFNDCWWLFKQRAFLDGGMKLHIQI